MTDPVAAGVVVIALSLGLIAFGVSVALSLMVSGLAGLLLFRDQVDLASYVFFESTNIFALTAVPLFILLGEVLLRCGVSDTIYRGTSRLFAWAPGGLLHSNIASCALFSAISGSSPATAATVGTVAIPELAKRGYDTRMTLGSLAAGGTLGILIPPSINLIIYGMLANASVGRLFMGGVLPGIILTALFMGWIAAVAIARPGLAPRGEPFSLPGAARGLLELWPAYFLAVIVLGGIFAGLMTPTEAAAVGSAAALLLALVLGRLSWSTLKLAVGNTLTISCMVLFVYVGAMILSSFFGVMGIPRAISSAVVDSGWSAYAVLFAVFVVYLVLGCFLDGVSMMVLTVPIVVPLLESYGFDKIWFGVVLVVLCEIGMITPPTGLNLYVIQGISQKPLWEVVMGVAPYFFIMLFALALFTVFPQLVMWLPSTMMR